MSNINKIKWFLKELDLLINQKIITNNEKDKLLNYYKSRIENVKKQKSDFFIKILLFSLGILAGLSIIGGVILVAINFNWRLLTKEVKTFFSFLLLIIPQFLCAYLLFFKKKDSILIKEIFSLILSIMFGVTVAFIGQIYQLSSNIESYLLTWIFSTLFIIYIFNSLSSVPFYLILTIVLSSIMKYKGEIGLIFYPLVILLIPFYMMEYRKKNKFRIMTLNYFFVTSIVIGLGISMEKTIPGLWIVAYSNLFVIFYLFGVMFEKQTENTLLFTSGNNLFFSPAKLIGILGTCIMAFILIQGWPWKEIGWNYFRSGADYNYYAGFFDYSISIIMPAISLALGFLLLKKKKAFNLIVSIFGILILLLFLLKSFFYKSLHIELFINTLLLFYIFGFSVYFFYQGYKKNSNLITVSSFIFFIITAFYRFFMDYYMFKTDYEFVIISFSSLISIFILFYLCGMLFENNNDEGKIKLSKAVKAIGIIGATITLYVLSFKDFWRSSFENNLLIHHKAYLILTFIINLVFPIVIGLLFFLMQNKKKNINYLLIFSGLFTLILFFIATGFKIPEEFANLFSLIIVLYILILGIHFFYIGYRNKSSLTIFISSLYLFLNISTRFFTDEINALFRGFSLIGIGLIFVFVNVYFIKKIKKGF